MGTPHFAVPVLNSVASREEITLVVTNPDRPKGRGRSVAPPPVKEAAKSLGIPVYQPGRLKENSDAFERIRREMPDFIVVVAYGQILPPGILGIPRITSLNVHASLLPKYRGAAPINWAIIEGEEKTGITIMEMEEGLDSGPILLLREEAILKEDRADSLAVRLSLLGARSLVEVLEQYREGKARGVPQDHDRATYAPMIKGEDGKIDWNCDAVKIRNLSRGLYPRPGAYTTYKGKRLKVTACSVERYPAAPSSIPGDILEVRRDGIVVRCGRGNILITRLQPEGKREVDGWSYVQGYRVMEGQRLGE